MDQNWRTALRTWANQCASEFAGRDGILGVIMGGSLARGQEWRHSDLELGILVTERMQNLPYFNIDAGHGVEAIQLVQGELEEQVLKAETGNCSPLFQWPIQLWRGRVIHDPTGILGRFKTQFDDGLFKEQVIEQRIEGLRQNINKNLDEARGFLAEDRPAAALVRTRTAMNDAILAFHWSKGELPRSQNRTDSRLRLICRKHNDPAFYALYRDVFGLHDARKIIQSTWPAVKDSVLEITRLWGDTAHDFFLHAVDSNFQWRQNAGILTVYRLYIPIIGGPEQGIFAKLDDAQWAGAHKKLMIFLGFANANKETVSTFVERLASVSGTLTARFR